MQANMEVKPNENEEIVYVYLEMNEKLTPAIFENRMFLRIADLEKANPHVQINDMVFKGTYEDLAGTNLFFEEIEPPLQQNIYEKNTAIKLKHVCTQTKVIQLKQWKLPRKVVFDKQSKEFVNLNFNQDYNTLLKKLEQGYLNIEDFGHKDSTTESAAHKEIIDFSQDEPAGDVNSQNTLEATRKSSKLELKYARLLALAKRPVRRMKLPELIDEVDPKYKDAYEYHNLEKLVLQPSDTFHSVSQPIIEGSLQGGIDLESCVTSGLITPTLDVNRTLSKEEQNRVLTLDNLANLSIPARYLLLKECTSRIEKLIEETPNAELKQLDENGKSIVNICNIFRKLTSALQFRISSESVVNIQVKESSESLLKDENYHKFKPSSSIKIDVPELFNTNEWIPVNDNCSEQEWVGSDGDDNESEENFE